MKRRSVVKVDPEIMSGIPCFAGTRIPARTLFDYLEGGDSLEEFLEDFPTVSRKQAIALLEEASELLALAPEQMRILLDECLPVRLGRELPGHEVQTVPRAGWSGIKDGRLLRLIAETGVHDVFITMDKSLPHQQNSKICLSQSLCWVLGRIGLRIHAP